MNRADLEKIRPVPSVVWLLIAYSLTLAGLKFWMSSLTASEAIESDGWNNFADSVYAILLAFGLYIASRPADASHPHGHRRFESMIGLGVGFIIIGTGVYILVECRKRYLAPTSLVLNGWVIAGIGALMLSKFWMAGLCRRAGESGRRPVLTAIGNDQRMDVMATFSAMAGYGSGVWWSPKLDAMFAGVISIWVFKVGVDTAWEHVHQLTGRSAPPEILHAITRAVDESPVLFGMNDLRTHHVGPEFEVSLNVFAWKSLTLEAVHSAEEDLKEKIGRIPRIAAVFIHVEPHESSGGKKGLGETEK